MRRLTANEVAVSAYLECRHLAHLKDCFLIGARHSLEQLVDDDASLSDEEVVDSYLDLVREGLAVPDRNAG